VAYTLTAAVLEEIRSYAPEEWTPEEHFDDLAVDAAYQRNQGNVSLTAASLVRKKLALMLEDPDTFSIPGEYSQSGASQIAALRELAKRLETEAASAREVIAGAGTSFRAERVNGWGR
jgi:hypothetical protein